MIARVDFVLFVLSLFQFCLFLAIGIMDMVVFFFAQRSEMVQQSCISFNICLNQFQTSCQIFPFLFPVKLAARQFLFEGNYDDGKENIFIFLNHNDDQIFG